jgi:hypothetical protein
LRSNYGSRTEEKCSNGGPSHTKASYTDLPHKLSRPKLSLFCKYGVRRVLGYNDFTELESNPDASC